MCCEYRGWKPGCTQVELCPCGSMGSDLCAVSTGVGSLAARRQSCVPVGSMGSDLCAVSTGVGSLAARR